MCRKDRKLWIHALLLAFFSLGAGASIDLTLDINGVSNPPTTTSDKVFVKRVELSFANQRPETSVRPGTRKLYALARFSYVGNGSLTARWLVDDRVFAQYSMILSFGDQVEIRSDRNNTYLPTFERGFHKVSLQLIDSDGAVDQSARAIRYFVGDGVSGQGLAEALDLMFPVDRPVEARDFFFRWRGDKIFSAYRLELESLGKGVPGQQASTPIFQALSKTDVFSPTPRQRRQLTPGPYRWRVSGFSSDKNAAPVISGWGYFQVAPAGAQGGVFIYDIRTSSAGPSSSLQFSQSLAPIADGDRLTRTKSIVKKGKADAGSPYQLELTVQNSGASRRDGMLVRISDPSGVIGQYPIDIGAGRNATVKIPLHAPVVDTRLIQNLGVSLVADGAVVDAADINLTIEPQLRLDRMDFNEIKQAESGNFPIADPYGCATGSADRSQAFSRIVSAWLNGQDDSEQSLFQQGYFQFDEGQQVQFQAYFKDQGLGAWFDGPSGSCVTAITKGRVGVRRNHPLQFVAQPLDRFGQPDGEAFAIGQTTFTTGFEGMLSSPAWTIPKSGHYRITLNDIGDPADLYATLPGGFPKYIHAAGFVAELQTPVAVGSAITSVSPRQAMLSGRALIRWQGDRNHNEIALTMDQMQVTMNDPLHGRLSGGEMRLDRSPNRLVPILKLYGQTHRLLDLRLTVSGARASLDYRLPSGFRQAAFPAVRAPVTFNQLAPSPSPVSAQGGRASDDRLAAITSTGPSTLVFDDVVVINGGEFVAQYEFDDRWRDQKLKNGDLALRLAGSTLVVDASPHLSYTAYTDQPAFTGVGLHNPILRLRVNESNGLFSVANADKAFLYGQAKWLSFTDGALSGEHLTLKPATDIAPFFGQTPDETLQLLQPYGFSLRLDGGEFGLQDSVVGGVNLSGSVTLDAGMNDAVPDGVRFNFDHLVRSASGQHRFETENKSSKSLVLSADVYRYRPARLQFLIGSSQPSRSRRGAPALDAGNPVLALSAENIRQWQEQLLTSLKQRTGLIGSGGELSRGWYLKGDQNPADTAIRKGAFLIDANGMSGQWREQQDETHYELNGFDTTISSLWMEFEDSALTDSRVSGQLNIPYPVGQAFRFEQVQLDQQALPVIPRNGLHLPDSGELLLNYWHVGLRSMGEGVGLTSTSSAVRGQVFSPVQLPSAPIIYNRERKRIELSDMRLSLRVDEALGGDEFVTEDGSAPFVVDTHILPDGQLAETSAHPTQAALFFIGQPFDVSSIQFAPYFGDHQPPAEDQPATAQPLVEVKGTISFKVFGSREVTVEHTALGAQVPQISTIAQGDWGEGAIRVDAQLKFINSYALNPEITGKYKNLARDQARSAAPDDPPAIADKPFKAFVGTADLVVLGAVSIRGLAEAGIHDQQQLLSPGRWSTGGNAPQKAYEKIGLGMGADILKATIAGLQGIETVTRLGGAVVSAAAGVEGTGEQVIELGTDAVAFVGAVSVAVGVTVGTVGVGSPVIRNAIDSGLTMTNSGIELLETICDERSDCGEDQALMLDISSLLVRIAGSITHFEQLAGRPKEVASIALQALDVGIPLLMGFDLDAAYAMTGVPPLTLNGQNITFNDKKNAALSVAHVMVGASRTLVDNNLRIPFNDFLAISRKTVQAARSLQALQGVEQGLKNAGLGDVNRLMDLSFDLADASIDIASGFSAPGGGQNLVALAGRLTDELCRQSDALQPLFDKAGVPAVGAVIEQPLSLTRAVLSQTQGSAMPRDPRQVLQFMQTLLEALSQAGNSLQGCGQSQVHIPQAAREVLKIAAHSLKPLDGSLVGDTGAQVAWAMQSVNLSIEALDGLAQQIGLNQLPQEVQEIKSILQQLTTSFIDFGNDLNLDANNGGLPVQAVLRLARQIPAAMRELVASKGSAQAAEILDLHIVLMRELQPLIEHAAVIQGGDLSGVDLMALPQALIGEMQDLSLLTQCQRSGLTNLAMTLSIARQLQSEQPKVNAVLDDLDSLYRNIQACDATGITQTPQLAGIMQLLQLLRALSADASQAQALVRQYLPILLPVFMDSATQMVDGVHALVAAMPIADFTQDDRARVLDGVLDRLLGEVEQQTSNANDRAALRKARSIIRHAVPNQTGLTLTQDGNGQIIGIEELRPDGSKRQINLTLNAARQFYPEGHPDFHGGLEELLSDVALPDGQSFEQLSEADRNSLFTPFWDTVFDPARVVERRYKDEQNNRIAIDNSTDITLVQIIDAVGYARFTPRRQFSVPGLPARGASAQQLDAESGKHYYSAQVYREFGDANPDCVFSDGCAYKFDGSGAFIIQSVHNLEHYALYSDAGDARSELDDLRPRGPLMEYQGYINSNDAGWNPAWRVHYRSGVSLVLRHGQSLEILDIGALPPVDTPAQIPSLLGGIDQFAERRVVNGNDIWDFIPGQHALHNYGNGQWEIYQMPDRLAAGTAVPAPQSLIDPAQLQLMARGDQNGITEDPAGLGNQLTSSGGQSIISLPGDGADETVTITLGGPDSPDRGQIKLGQTGLAVAAASDADADQIQSSATQTDGSQLLTLSNGDTQILRGTASDNLIITQTTSSNSRGEGSGGQQYHRQVKIQFCIDKELSWSHCPAAQRVERQFDYDWITDYRAGEAGYVDIDPAQRPVVTPASGVNRSIKHQFWVDIFALEQQLLAAPDEQGLQQLGALVQRALEAGLPEDELRQQQRYIAARLINRLMIRYFNEADQQINDLSVQQQWLQQPSSSPEYKIARLHERLNSTGFAPNRNFFQRARQLVLLQYRLFMQDLQDFAPGNGGQQITRDLSTKISALTAVMARAQQLGDDDPALYNIDNACLAIADVEQFIRGSMVENPDFVVLESDLKLVLDLSSASQMLGCGGNDELLDALPGLAQRAANQGQGYDGLVQAARLQRLAQAILRQDPQQDDLNQDGQLDSRDVTGFYLRYLMRQDSEDATALTQPAVTEISDWVRHVLNLDRLARETENRNGGPSAFAAAPVFALSQQLTALLKSAWQNEYQRLYDQYIDSTLTTSLEDAKKLATHYETAHPLNTRLAAVAGQDVIETDAGRYLKVKIDGQWLDPLQAIAQQQTQWLDNLWLQTPDTQPQWALLLSRLREQDEAIAYLIDALPDDQKGSLARLGNRVAEKIDLLMDTVASDLAAYQGDSEGLDGLLGPIGQLHDFLDALALGEARQRARQRVQALIDQAIERIRDDYADSALEIGKIIAITRIYQGPQGIEGTGLADNENLLAALHEAGTATLEAIEQGGSVDDIRGFIALIGLQQSLGVTQPEWSVEQVYPRLSGLIGEAKSRLQSSQTEADAKALLDLYAYAAALGWDGEIDVSPITDMLSGQRGQLTGCIDRHDCSASELKRYLELTASLQLLGGDGGDYLNTLDQMMSSSPDTLAVSMRFESSLPDLQQLVLQDKTGQGGRQTAASVLQRIGDGLSVDSAAGRAALRLVIKQLQQLANMNLPAGHQKPAPARDALLQSAQTLQQKIDDWTVTIAQQIETRGTQQNGPLLNDSPSAVAQSLGVTEQELDTVVLPRINGAANASVRILPANKYQLAADALAPVTTVGDRAGFRLALRLLQNLPDPQVTAEADYRLAARVQLAAFMLQTSGEALPPQINADSLKQTAVGGLVLALLSLPAQDHPAGQLLDYIEQRLQLSLDETCNELAECLLQGVLQLSANVLDGSLLALQQNRDDLLSNDRKALALGLLQKLAANISNLAQSDANNPVVFWSGMAAQGMNLSLQMAQGGASGKTLLAGALGLSATMLKSSAVTGVVDRISQVLPQAEMAHGFVTQTSDLLVRQLDGNGDQHLAVAIARLAQQNLFNTLQRLSLNQQLIDVGGLLANWQLDLVDQDQTWGLITSANPDPGLWIDVLLGEGGIATLNAAINDSGLLQQAKIPAALALTPFIAARSLLNHQAELGQPDRLLPVIVDLAADLSNSWFLPLDYSGGLGVPADEDKPLAELIRSLKAINPDDSAQLQALALVGNTGIAGMRILLPGTALGNVMTIAWNGGNNGGGTGIVDAIDMGMRGSAQPIEVLTLAQGLPPTMGDMITAVSQADAADKTARLLRILSATTRPEDLLPPDRSLGNPFFESILVALGDARRLVKTDFNDQQHATDTEFGYLRTVPFLSIDSSGKPVLSSNASFKQDMLEMVEMAKSYNLGGATQSATVVTQKVLLAGVDIGRLGINALLPLLNRDSQSAVADIQGRSVFSDLAGDSGSTGFSGVSGGLLTEWDAASTSSRTDSRLTLEMYGQLSFPLLGTQNGLMQFVQDSTGSSLYFEAASEAGSRILGGLEGDMKAELRNVEQELSLSYWGKSKLEILGNKIVGIDTAGSISGFPDPTNKTPTEYARQLLEHVQIEQCGSLTTNTVPFPLSLSGVGGTATVGGFAGKNDGLSMTVGGRIGLSGNLSAPLFSSLLGLELAGNVTTAYTGDMEPQRGDISLQAKSCISPRARLKLLGQDFYLSGADLQTQTAVSKSGGSVITDLKFRLSLNGRILSHISAACNNTGFNVAKKALCEVLKHTGNGKMWVVVHSQSGGNGSIMPRMYLGMGDFPAANSETSLFLSFNIGGEMTLSDWRDVVSTSVGSWGGWDNGVDNRDLCSQSLCQFNNYPAEPGGAGG